MIDHACKPEIAQGSWPPWEREMQFIADETMALCKLSGLPTQARTTQASALEPWLRHALESFGPARVL